MLRILLLALCVSFAAALPIHSSMQIQALPGENLAVGGSLKRMCVVASNLKWKVSWQMPDGSESNGPRLEVNNLSAASSGQYTCIARQKESGGVMKSLIEIAFSPEIKLETLPGEKIQIGGSLLRKCFLSPAPKGTDWSLEWRLPDGTKSSGGHLEITNLQVKNAGIYSCVATHKPSGKTMVASLGVKLGKPIYQKVRLHIETGEGNNLVLSKDGVLSQVCKVNDAGWKLHWVKPNNEKIPSGKLVVKGLSEKDFGVYKCFAEKNGQTMAATFKIGV